MTSPCSPNSPGNQGKAVIPTVDLSVFLDGTASAQHGIAELVDHVCQTSGFLVIENHGVEQQIIEQTWSMAREFFELPLDTKLKTRSSDPRCPRGYFPPESETLAKSRGVTTPPDQKEAFSCGPLSVPKHNRDGPDFDFFYGENLWPDKPRDFRESWMRYYQSMELLGSQLMRLFAAALKLPQDYFVEFHTHHISALRALNYPSTTAKLMPGQQRAGAHSDYGSVTILKPDLHVGGLEIRLPSGKWLAAPLIENTYVINIGDMMARWTNDRWVSTLHRVVSPTEEEGGLRRQRQSIAYFLNPNFDANVSCIPTCLASGESALYRPVKAGRYLSERFNAAV